MSRSSLDKPASRSAVFDDDRSRAKGRPENRALPILVNSIEQAVPRTPGSARTRSVNADGVQPVGGTRIDSSWS